MRFMIFEIFIWVCLRLLTALAFAPELAPRQVFRFQRTPHGITAPHSWNPLRFWDPKA